MALIVSNILVDFKSTTSGNDENQSKKSKGGHKGKKDSKVKPSKWPKKKKK